METVGIYLKREREAKNISLSEVSRLTKISRFYLDYIEQDNFAKLPQGPYIKGYISSYSRFIGSNVDQVLQLYDALNKKEDEPDPPPDKRRRRSVQTYCTALRGETRTAFRAMASIIRDKRARLEVSAPVQKMNALLFKTAHPSLERQTDSTARRLPQIKRNLLAFAAGIGSIRRRTWWLAGMVLIGAGILALAGVGFYHLFIYDEYPAMPNHTSERKQPPASPVVSGEKSPRPAATGGLAQTASSRAPRAAEAPPGPAVTVKRADSNRRAIRTAAAASTAKSGIRKESLPDRATAAAPVSVLKASVCSAIKDRMPSGVDTTFPASVPRVYVWSQIDAKTIPARIRHIYYFNGRKISDVSLDVRSSFWRTWSYKSISNDRFRGQWRVDIASADGKVLRRLFFEIQ